MFMEGADGVILAPPATSYANAGGTGNRTGLITVTFDVTGGGGLTAGTPSNMVDGAFSANASDGCDPPAVSLPINFQFEFPTKKYIDEITLYFSNAAIFTSTCNLVVSGRDPISLQSYSLGSDFLGSAFTTSPHVISLANAPLYPSGFLQFGMLFSPSGGNFGTGFFLEAEFKIADGAL